jgi:hypothetical protein
MFETANVIVTWRQSEMRSEKDAMQSKLAGSLKCIATTNKRPRRKSYEDIYSPAYLHAKNPRICAAGTTEEQVHRQLWHR